MRYRGLDTAAVVREVFESAVLMGRKALKTLGGAAMILGWLLLAWRGAAKSRKR
jgi:uncharacterized membrane protein YgdD (TMEM256/DUF423 family)